MTNTRFQKIPALSVRHFALVFTLFASLGIAAFGSAKAGPAVGLFLAVLALCLGSASVTRRAPALFANNFGILNNTILLHDVFSLFMAELLPIMRLVIDVQDPKTGARDAKPGDTITIKDWRQSFSLYSVGSSGYNTVSDIATADTQVTLPNTAKAVSIALTAAEFRVLASGASGGVDYAAFRDKLQKALRQTIGLGVCSDFLAKITAANFPNWTTSAVGTFARSTELALDGALFSRNVPREGAQAILNGAAFLEWVGDHVSMQTNTPNAQTLPRDLLIEQGRASDTSPIIFQRTNLTMPTDAPRGFVITKTGMVGAFRVPSEATYEQDPVSLSEVVEPTTGVPILGRLWKNPTTGVMQLDMASIWTFVKGQAEAVQRILAADPS